MPLLTDCASCGKPISAPAEGTYACPHCTTPVTIVRVAQPPQKVPVGDYWLFVKVAFWVFLALVFIVALGSSFLG